MSRIKPIVPPVGRPHAEVVSRQMGDGAVLVHLGTNTIFELNRTGARAWELLGQNLTADRIASTLVSEFDVEPDRASRELEELVDQLSAAGLLVT